MFVIGIDPHKRSHTAAVLDEGERLVGEVRVDADRRQRDRLLEFAAPFTPRTWAIEAASGLGAMLAQQLVAVGEVVLDVPPALSARVRLLDSGHNDKNDAHDARSAAVVAMRHGRLRAVRVADQQQVLRLLSDRHHQLTRTRTQTINRLHSLVCELVEGGLPLHLSADRAAKALRHVHPLGTVETERKRIALDLLVEVRRLDTQLAASKTRLAEAVTASGTTVTDVFGVGPVVAAIICGHVGDVRRFPSAGHFARYNGTAPIEASSGPRVRHRLNPRGNRQINHALHIAALVQISHDSAGRAYFERKLAEGKSKKEAIRSLKRRISDAVYRQLVLDTEADKAGREDTQGRLAKSSVAGSNPERRRFGPVTPEPKPRRYARTIRRCSNASADAPLTQRGFAIAAADQTHSVCTLRMRARRRQRTRATRVLRCFSSAVHARLPPCHSESANTVGAALCPSSRGSDRR